MIRRGRKEGWLRFPISRLEPWAKFVGVYFDGIKVGSRSGYEHLGSSIIAKRRLEISSVPLVTVPRELIISLETIQTYAKRCQPLSHILEALGEFGQVCLPVHM
jgi:hypothetical protein